MSICTLQAHVLNELTYEYQPKLIDISKMFERKDSPMTFNIYEALINSISVTPVLQILDIYNSLYGKYPRTRSLVYLGLKERVSYCFSSSNSVSGKRETEQLTYTIIDRLLQLPPKKYKHLLRIIVLTRNIDWFPRDQYLLWKNFPQISKMVYQTIFNNLASKKEPFDLGIYFRQGNYTDIVPFLTNDWNVRSAMQDEFDYNTETFSLSFQCRSQDFSEEQQSLLWRSGLHNSCRIIIYPDRVQICAFADIVQEYTDAHGLLPCGEYKLYSQFTKSIETLLLCYRSSL